MENNKRRKENEDRDQMGNESAEEKAAEEKAACRTQTATVAQRPTFIISLLRVTNKAVENMFVKPGSVHS